MFEALFKGPAVVARHCRAPLQMERRRFLEECSRQGYSGTTLDRIAWVLMAVAESIDFDQVGLITEQEIEQAVARRVSPTRPEGSHAFSSRKLFKRFAVRWLRSMGRLEEPAEERRFGKQVDAFAWYMLDQRGLSPVTVATHCERLAWLFDGLCPPPATLREISLADLDAFIATMHAKGWARTSLAALTRSLRSFFRYAEGQGWCASGLSAAIDSPRLYTRERLPEGPAWQDVQRLIASARGNNSVDIRDHAILLLLSLYGFRRGEVAALRLDDLDWVGEVICVTRPKQRITHRYPLLPVVGEAIIRYLRDRRRCGLRQIFLAVDAPIRPLSAASISAMVRMRLKAVGIDVPSRGAHCLRHACASHLLASGFTLKQIGDHLGHRSVNSTLSYTKIDLNGLRKVADLDLEGLL
jgi:site-specific recombinase XerD